MADEMELITETHLPINFTKATGLALEQGEIVELANDMTAITATANDFVAGIVHTEVTATEASASVSLYRGGIFRGTASAAITIGQTLAMTGSGNRLKASVAGDTGSRTVGIALQQASGNGERFLFELSPGVGVNAFA